MYKWIPAGVTDDWLTNGWCYITYGRTGVESMVAEYDEQARLSCVKLPDRVLRMTWYQDHQRPLAETFDECFRANIYDPGSFAETFLSHILLSYPMAGLHSGLYNTNFAHGTSYTLMGDSGGNQLKVGTIDYIDPYAAIDWYNRMGLHEGTALDLPPKPTDQKYDNVLNACAEVQKRNNDVFADYARDGLQLMNVVHGFTIEQVREWASIVEHDRFRGGWGIGSDHHGSDMANFRSVMTMVQDRAPERIHRFAVGGSGIKVPAMAWAGRYVPLLTSDSTNFLDSMKWRCYFHVDARGRIQRPNVGSEDRDHSKRKGKRHYKRDKEMISMAPLPCSCPVCARVGYPDVFGLPAKYGSATLLAYHNIFTLSKLVDVWDRAARNAESVDDYIDFVLRFQKRDRQDNDLISTIRYVDFAKHHGVEEADRKFRRQLADAPIAPGRIGEIFVDPKHGKRIGGGADAANQIGRNGILFKTGNLSKSRVSSREQGRASDVSQVSLIRQPSIVESGLSQYMTSEELADRGIRVMTNPLDDVPLSD